MIVVERNPSSRDLWWFALGFAIVVVVAGAWLWHGGSHRAATVVWAIGSASSLGSFAFRPVRRALFVGWMVALSPVAWLVSYAILIVIWFLIATPTGVVLRLIGHDPLRRRFDPDAATYWTPREPTRHAVRYFRQF